MLTVELKEGDQEVNITQVLDYIHSEEPSLHLYVRASDSCIIADREGGGSWRILLCDLLTQVSHAENWSTENLADVMQSLFHPDGEGHTYDDAVALLVNCPVSCRPIP